MTTALSLAQMVDLALGTPEVGAVNFNVLHSLLHALLRKLELGGLKADINESDRVFFEKLKDADIPLKDTLKDGDSMSVDGQDGVSQSAKSEKDSGVESSIPVSQTPYHQLMDRVNQLEKQMQSLNDIPSNNELFEKLKSRGEGERPRPMADMWQGMQLTKRVDTNEEGIGKLMSMFEDMMSELQGLKDTTSQLRKDMDNLTKNSSKYDDQYNDLLARLKELDNLMKDLNERFGQFPGLDEFSNWVTWPGLEDALKGIKDSMEYKPPERIVIEMNTQTSRPETPVEPAPSTRPTSAYSTKSRTTTPGPSEALVEILENIGSINNRHDVLEERVTIVEEELKNKANKSDLEGLGSGGPIDVPSDLLDQLKEMQDQISRLQRSREKDSDALTRMQQVLLQLQAEVDRISNHTHNLMEDSTNQQKLIDQLFGITTNLDERKADKEFVHMEVDVKADKKFLESKVNRSIFDNKVSELDKLIKELLDKLFGHEDEWKKALGDLSTDIDGKLDRLEFKPIRDDLERQLKAIMKKINNLDLMGDYGDDDAAGIRKQLLQRFHCISCDRPVDMMPTGPIPSIPASQGLPATRSTRPYTTFELDQIRQTARSTPVPALEVTDMYATTRSCGGTHTMTYPHRRITRMTHINNLFQEDIDIIPISPAPPYKEELDIQGADGHIYRGRTPDGRLPYISPTGKGGRANQNGGSPTMTRRAQTSPGQAHAQLPTTPTTPRGNSGRPDSARLSRPTSGNVLARPHSATPPKEPMPPTEVPTGRDSVPPPPSPPAPSERATSAVTTEPQEELAEQS